MTPPEPSAPTFVFTVPAPSVPAASAAPPRRGLANKALWLIGLGLVANAAVLLYTHVTGRPLDLMLDRAAFGQTAGPGGAQPLVGARGLYMMPAQLGPQTFGLYLMDVDSGTICVYRALPESSHFRLMAARSFRYDRFLEDFNNEPLRPKDVQKLVEDQRQRQDLQSRDGVPTVDQMPKPDENQSITREPAAPR
jgi:hypothetical protein